MKPRFKLPNLDGGKLELKESIFPNQSIIDEHHAKQVSGSQYINVQTGIGFLII